MRQAIQFDQPGSPPATTWRGILAATGVVLALTAVPAAAQQDGLPRWVERPVDALVEKSQGAVDRGWRKLEDSDSWGRVARTGRGAWDTGRKVKAGADALKDAWEETPAAARAPIEQGAAIAKDKIKSKLKTTFEKTWATTEKIVKKAKPILDNTKTARKVLGKASGTVGAVQTSWEIGTAVGGAIEKHVIPEKASLWIGEKTANVVDPVLRAVGWGEESRGWEKPGDGTEDTYATSSVTEHDDLMDALLKGESSTEAEREREHREEQAAARRDKEREHFNWHFRQCKRAGKVSEAECRSFAQTHASTTEPHDSY